VEPRGIGLSGVDPGIIRELSGIYKPFIKAFKELISNAYDADAKRIAVNIRDDFSTIEVDDDGNGMTPYDFHEGFARLGGSTAWLRDGKSPGGRSRIGYKGIGFLATARYCRELRVESHAIRPFIGSRSIEGRGRKVIPLREIVGDLVPVDLVKDKIAITRMVARSNTGESRALSPKDFQVDGRGNVRIRSARALKARAYTINYKIDCRHLLLEASLDFDYILGLEHRGDLRVLADFCTVSYKPAAQGARSHTRVTLCDLKDFVVRELSAPRTKGKARNIIFKSGKEQFLWRLARTSPIRDDLSEEFSGESVCRFRELQEAADLPMLVVKWRSEEPITLLRPLYLATGQAIPFEETVVPVEIDENGLRVSGYLLARSEIIYPAELRGISIRVRNVAIGDASFLGWEHILSGPRKAAMSQITGELLVLDGLDAADAINPGRESFYEENHHYRVLKRALFGSEESIGGLVNKAIKAVLDRSRVRSQVNDKIVEARRRRKVLVDISSAVNYYARVEDPSARGLLNFFDTPIRADGLASSRDVPTRPQYKLAGFELENRVGLKAEVEIDYQRRKVRVDFDQDTWNTTIYLHGHYYEVLLKQGRPDHPICEFDNEGRRIFVNWGHPVKLHMDDTGFLKSAILLRLAYHAAPRDADAMMNLALNMLSFRAE